MLSRRSVRIKAMQLLYSKDRDSALKKKDLIKGYDESINSSYELFLYNLFLIKNITSAATKDLEKRKSKHLPSDYDKSFTDKLYTNALIADLVDNALLIKQFEKLKFDEIYNSEYTAKIYDEFQKKEEYRAYIQKESSNEETLEILLELYRFCRQNEYFNEMLEDAYFNWSDDKSLVVGAVKKYLKALPNNNAKLFTEFLPEDDTVQEFGKNLLVNTLDQQDDLMKIIIPVLENWDHERLAIVDTLLLQLAVCEMLNFKTIPAKVSLNEYVELGKQYSTEKSKEFINGILDKIMKDLSEKGQIVKEGRGLMD